jgi:hypothetical protein
MEKQQITVALDRDVMEVVDRQAEAERSSKSTIIRRVVSTWAKSLAEPAPRLVAAIALCAVLMTVAAAIAEEVPGPHSLTIADIYRLQHRIGVDRLVVARIGAVYPVDADGCIEVQVVEPLPDGSWRITAERECVR